MKFFDKSIIFSVALLLIHIQPLFSCGDHHHHTRQIRHSLLKAMGMNDREVGRVNQEKIDEAETLLPMLNTYRKKRDDVAHFLSHFRTKDNEHILSFNNSITSRSPTSATLSYTLGPLPHSSAVLVEVYARAKNEEENTIISTSVATLNRSERTQFMTVLGNELIHGWFNLESRAIALSIVVRDVETDKIIYEGENEQFVKGVKISLSLATPLSRRRRNAEEEEENKCKTNDGNEECCVITKKFTREELNLPNLISPSTLWMSWCNGQCNKESSFQSYFSRYSSLMNHDSKDGPACCHATEYDDMEIIFMDAEGQARSSILYDMVALTCKCN
ncbi:hypothetical protein PRIPAC_95727 [Pristionchus pacificus]|uniref:TGF_BETA_2 domain-containing protein n=1 Tax=Pristionchus pacificus TaxID=54126 RepID=A0A454Y4J7_PRIPA|nr:hypothetical protein PRIPAC_95727 [Pristionchus pacificus]|eukprot:PDM63978.1 hypothetical protein PRIPAC_49479 [Pristionchus pacificus]